MTTPVPLSLPQISLAGGVISPATYSRLDLQKFGVAAKGMDNFFVHAEGGISNRSGSEQVHEIKDSTAKARDITFEFNESQAYALQFENLIMRVVQNGALVLNSTAQTITGATAANPVVVTSANAYTNGEEVFIQSVVGMVELNNRFFIVANASGASYELTDRWGANIDGTSFTAYVSGGTGNTVFELVTPYISADLALLKFRQSNDIMYLTHISYEPRKLSRTDHDVWSLDIIDYSPDQVFPVGITAIADTTGAITYMYKVTALNADTSEESLVGTGTTQAITGATQADPVVLTVTGHPFADGDEIHISGIIGMTELNGRRFIIANQATNTVELKGEDGSGYTAWSSGGSADRTNIIITNGATTADNTLTILDTIGADRFNIYKSDNGLYGFIGSTETNSFTDSNIAADLNDTAPKLRQPFRVAGNYPGAVGLHEQRSIWGNTINDPLSTFMSQTSQFENMNVSSPTKDTDAITLRLVTGQGNEIRHYRSFEDRLFAFTSGAVWTIEPGSGVTDAITPSSKKVTISDYLSSTSVPPITIKKNILMISGKQDVGFEVHSLGAQVRPDGSLGYVGSDLTVLARHLFEGFTLSEWAYAERPFRLVAAVRSDGKIIVMTYLQEHQVFAWTIWESASGGLYESICSVPEGQEDVLYVIVKRIVDGRIVRYQERFHTRVFTDIKDAFFVDSGLTLDITDPLTITSATKANPVVIGCINTYSDGDHIFINSVEGMEEINNKRFTIANVTGTTYELAGEDGTGYTTFTGTAISQLQVNIINNLQHLEGEEVIALNNGNLELEHTVSDGSIILNNYGSVIQVGLGYLADFESLPVNPDPRTIDKKKVVKSLSLRVLNTRGISAGPSKDNMDTYPARSTELWGDPAALKSDIIHLTISGDWKRDSGYHIQSERGLPMTILSVVPNTNVGRAS